MFLSFLKEFTKVALDKNYSHKKNQYAMQVELAEDGQVEEDFDSELTSRENILLTELSIE